MLVLLVCCSIFNDLRAAFRDSLFIIPLSLRFVKPFFKKIRYFLRFYLFDVFHRFSSLKLCIMLK